MQDSRPNPHMIYWKKTSTSLKFSPATNSEKEEGCQTIGMSSPWSLWENGYRFCFCGHGAEKYILGYTTIHYMD